MNGEDEEFAHEANGTTTIIACKTARHRRIPSLEKAAAACFGLIPKERTGAHLPIIEIKSSHNMTNLFFLKNLF